MPAPSARKAKETLSAYTAMTPEQLRRKQELASGSKASPQRNKAKYLRRAKHRARRFDD